MQEYWRESVEQNAAYEVSFTLGMRGIHDSGFRTRAIDENAALSEKQKLEARVRLLEKVITDQREIIRSVLHHERPDQALQVFIPYKGVLPLYDAGLALPEDITVMWTNDNFGHIRRYPSKQEQMRKGGHALYFHSSYWAPAPLSYLFINSIPLAQTGCELRKAYENGIRKIWVDNVGALKPLEQDMEYFLAFGWDAARAEALVHHIHEYLVRWFNEQFSGNFGEECARIYEAYAQITNVCKVEHLYRNAFSQTAYGDEASRRVNRLKELYSRVCRVHDALPADERDAFFELLGMKVSASYFINAAFYYADRSRLSYRQGKMQCADEYLHLSRRMMGCKRQMLYFYNHRMAGGKWKGILTPEAFPPPASCIYTDAKPALSIGETAMGIILWNEEEESPSAWRTPDGNGRVWEHLSAETNGGTGLSMMVEEPDLYWEKNGPALHFRGLFTGGKYYVWLLMRFDDPSNDACMVGIDGKYQPRSEQYGRGGFFTYSSQFLWVWTLLSEVEIAAGEHVFSLAAVKSGLRIDRIYLTKGRELPPDDAHFLPSPRHAK